MDFLLFIHTIKLPLGKHLKILQILHYKIPKFLNMKHKTKLRKNL